MTLVFLAVGLGSGAASLYLAHVAERQRARPATDGEVTVARVHKASGHWYLEIEYVYDVQQQQYVGHESRLLRKDFKSEAEALAHGRELLPGQPVRVSYDPTQPSRSTLDSQRTGFGFFTKTCALWLSLALAWFLYDRSGRSRGD